MCLCLQLYTKGGVATWRQTDVPNYGHSGVLMMPVKRMPPNDRVDPAAMEWQTMPTSSRRVGTAEVVLRGVYLVYGSGHGETIGPLPLSDRRTRAVSEK